MSAAVVIWSGFAIALVVFWLLFRSLIKNGTVKTKTPGLFFLSTEYYTNV